MPVAPYPTYTGPAGAGGVRPYEASGPAGFVRVGPRPAGPGGVVPYTRSVPGAGWVRVGPGRALTAASSGSSGQPSPSSSWTPPAFPPTGTFNPSRELETEEAGRGLQQYEGDVATKEARLRTDYATQLSEYGRQEGEQNDALAKGLALLKESYAKLGTRQEEGANKAGLLQGGALLQAAAKRGANEGKEAEKDREATNKQLAAIARARADYALTNAPPDASNPLGGRAWEDLISGLANAQSNQAFYSQGQQSLAAQEAAERGFGGYQPPARSAPAAARRPAPAPGRIRAGPGVPINRRTGRRVA